MFIGDVRQGECSVCKRAVGTVSPDVHNLCVVIHYNCLPEQIKKQLSCYGKIVLKEN